MAERSQDDRGERARESGFNVEKELLERRHEEEMETLKETFSKEKLKIMETRQAEQSVGQSTSNSYQYGTATQSSLGFVGQSVHAQSSGSIHNGSVLHGVQHDGNFGNNLSRGYDESLQRFSDHRSLTHPHGQLHDVHQQGYATQLGSPGHTNGVGASSSHDHQLGLNNGRMPHVASNFQNGNINSGMISSHQDVSSTGFSQQLMDSHFEQNRSTHDARNGRGTQLHGTGTHVLAQNDATIGLGYQAKMAKYSDGGYSRYAKDSHDVSGAKDVHRSKPWTPEFYTYNSSTSKESRGVTESNEKDAYGVSLELINGHAMRVNSSSLASQIRPDLDFEDRLEQQRELLQERFADEKRQLRRSLQEECVRKTEIEKRKYEESFQSLKKTNLELEYQRKETEIRIRHEREKLEMTYESRRAEYERTLRKDSEEHRSKSELKYEAEMQQQKEKFDRIIEKQKTDIESLTVQIVELNESLKEEKDLIVAKFESEVEDIEQRLRVQKEKTESELVVKLKSEISLLTSVNISLREEVNTKEKEKQELEIITKEERRRSEMNYESQISELEAHFEKEKQILLVQYEEKVTLLVKTEKSVHEEVSKTLTEELNSLKKDSEALRKLAEKNYEWEQEACSERDEIVQGLLEEKEMLRVQLQEALSKQQLSEDIRAESVELLRSHKDSKREKAREIKANLKKDLQSAEDKNRELTTRVEELLNDVGKLKKEQKEVGIVKQERERLLSEVAQHNKEIENMFEDVNERARREVTLKSMLNEVEKALGQKESEISALKVEKMENQNAIGVLERQCNDLKEDISTLRRQKIDVEQENSGLQREKSDCQGSLSVLKTTNDDLLQELQRAKQRMSQGEEEITSMKLGKLELQQEVRILKMNNASHKEAARRLNTRSESDGSGSVLTSADETEAPGSEKARRVKRRSSLERQIQKLKRTKGDYELAVEKLKQNVEALEREAVKQTENNKTLFEEYTSMKRDSEREMEKLKRAKKTLEDSVADVQQQERIIQRQISLLGKQKKELESALEFVMEEEVRAKEEHEKEMQKVSKTLDLKEGKVKRAISLLESTKKELEGEIQKMESDEASLRCSIKELQKESEILGQRISEMNEGVRDVTRKRVSWMDDEVDGKLSSDFKDVKKEITRLRRERNVLIRSVNDLERKQTNVDISVNAAEQNQQFCEKELGALMQKKKELETAVFSLKTEKFELETKINECSATSVEHVANAERKEIELLRSELEMTRENYENIRSMYQGVQNEGQAKVDVVETEIKMAEDSLLTLKRERLELEKTISTLLRQKTELESEVAMVVDAKFREDRDTTALREERMDLDAEVMRLKSQSITLRSIVSTLENTKCVAERELESLETRKERVGMYVSGMEARFLVGQSSPVSWNFNQSKDCVLTPTDELERHVLELKEQKLSLETDLFKLRRKSGDGIDTVCRNRCGERTIGDRRVTFGYLGTSEDNFAQCPHRENENLQMVIEGLAQEKSKLSCEVTEMKVRKTDLDAQITNLECRKLGLEQSERLGQRRQEDESEHVDVFSETTNVTSSQDFSSKMDFADYSVEEMQELRKKTVSLEDKFSTLERHLYDAKYEMEMQTLEYQKELRLVQDTIKCHQNEPRRQHQLDLLADRLKTFIAKSESLHTEKLYEEIKNEIKELNDKVDANSEQMRNIQKRSVSFKQDRTSHSMGSILNTDVDKICVHITEAEDGMERYDQLVSHLQNQNTDLMEIVSKLENRLCEAGKSHEMLQRKKTILQQLLETVGENTGKDLVEQSNLMFELDKDMPV